MLSYPNVCHFLPLQDPSRLTLWCAVFFVALGIRTRKCCSHCLFLPLLPVFLKNCPLHVRMPPVSLGSGTPWWSAGQPQLQVALAGIWNIVGLDIQRWEFSSDVNLKRKMMFSLIWLYFVWTKLPGASFVEIRMESGHMPYISFTGLRLMLLPPALCSRMKYSQTQPTKMLEGTHLHVKHEGRIVFILMASRPSVKHLIYKTA